MNWRGWRKAFPRHPFPEGGVGIGGGETPATVGEGVGAAQDVTEVGDRTGPECVYAPHYWRVRAGTPRRRML